MPALSDRRGVRSGVPAAALPIALWRSRIGIKIRIRTRTTTTKRRRTKTRIKIKIRTLTPALTGTTPTTHEFVLSEQNILAWIHLACLRQLTRAFIGTPENAGMRELHRARSLLGCALAGGLDDMPPKLLVG